MTTLSTHLTETVGPQLLGEQLRHPTVVGLAAGDLPDPVFRSWLEQDYLFLLDFVRVFARLAWQAPDGHLGDLVDVAHATYHDELALHRSLAADFDANLFDAIKGPAVRRTPGSCSTRPPTTPRAWPRCCPACGATRNSDASWRDTRPPSRGTRDGWRPTPTPRSRRSPRAAR